MAVAGDGLEKLEDMIVRKGDAVQTIDAASRESYLAQFHAD